MTTKDKHTHASSEEHGTAVSYVIGFVLSLIFTIIPYYLVVNKVLTGNALLVTILVIAVWQMFIQIIFFLHLGRGPKPLYNIVFFIFTAGTIILVVGASLFIMKNLYDNMLPDQVVLKQAQEENIAQVGGQETGACNEVKQNHKVTISNGQVEPKATYASLCDSLTIINEDSQEREFAFKRDATIHNHGEASGYGGIDIVLVEKGEPETVTLNEAGDVLLHDKLDSTTFGYIYVSE